MNTSVTFLGDEVLGAAAEASVCGLNLQWKETVHFSGAW